MNQNQPIMDDGELMSNSAKKDNSNSSQQIQDNEQITFLYHKEKPASSK